MVCKYLIGKWLLRHRIDKNNPINVVSSLFFKEHGGLIPKSGFPTKQFEELHRKQLVYHRHVIALDLELL